MKELFLVKVGDLYVTTDTIQKLYLLTGHAKWAHAAERMPDIDELSVIADQLEVSPGRLTVVKWTIKETIQETEFTGWEDR
jgi:hypothetical protein